MTYVFCNNSVPFTCYTDCIVDLDNDQAYYRLKLVMWSSKFLMGGCYTRFLPDFGTKLQGLYIALLCNIKLELFYHQICLTKLPFDPVSALLSM